MFQCSFEFCDGSEEALKNRYRFLVRLPARLDVERYCEHFNIDMYVAGYLCTVSPQKILASIRTIQQPSLEPL